MLKRLFFILCCLATLQAEAQIQEVIVGWDSTYFTYASTDNATYLALSLCESRTLQQPVDFNYAHVRRSFSVNSFSRLSGWKPNDF